MIYHNCNNLSLPYHAHDAAIDPTRVVVGRAVPNQRRLVVVAAATEHSFMGTKGAPRKGV